jgi:hypothetical protein
MRKPLPFNVTYFRELMQKGETMNMVETFNHIYQTNHWMSPESISGEGSDSTQTIQLKKELPILINEFKIKTMLDIPCGDFNWMNEIELNIEHYIGADIVEEIVQKNKNAYESESRIFQRLDLTKDVLPKTDLIFCRDCLVHLSFNDICKALENMKKIRINLFVNNNLSRVRRKS